MSSVINVRLNENMTLKFVELYRDQRLLWDREHEAYNKRTERLAAYRRIADEMAVEGLGVPEVASKIKNLRSTYLQELKKIKDSVRRNLQTAADGAEDSTAPYVPKLVWFPILDAMIGGPTVKRRVYSSPTTAEYLSIEYTDANHSENSYAAETNYGDSPTSFKREPLDEDSSAIDMYSNDTFLGKRRFSDEPSSAKRHRHEQQQSTAEMFSRYITTSLESLPPRLEVLAHKDIHDILIKYKLMDIDQGQR